MSNVPANSHVFKLMEEWAPKDIAYDWDNVGLQVGSHNRKASKIMVTLDVLEPVVDEAIANDIDVIIAHHPLLFKPLKQLNLDTSEGRILTKLIRHDITVYAAHTNLDIAQAGVNDMLAARLGLQQTRPLIPVGEEKLYKYAVHVPLSHMGEIKKAIGEAGGGEQGDYTHCSFVLEGTGSFKPVEGADPYIGEVGEIAEVEEVKIEALVTESNLHHVVKTVNKAHPYEEPAYDIIPLANEGESYGLGRIGVLSTATPLREYINDVKRKLGLSHVRVAGDMEKQVKTVAVLGGSGEKYMHPAKRAGADVYITGDVGFHQAQSAMQLGLSVIDAGHYIEEVMKEHVCDYLKQKLSDFDVEVMISATNTDPFQYY